MAIKYEDNKNVSPSPGSRHHATERPKYPPTIEFASTPSETHTRINEGTGPGSCRRPGGMYRGASHGFKSVHCYCGGSPCTCGTKTAKEFIDLPNINE